MIWRSSDNAVASVDNSGIVTANGRGAATLWTIDGSTKRLSDSNSQALSVHALDSDAYVLGVEGGTPVLWKNDRVLKYIDVNGAAKSVFLK